MAAITEFEDLLSALLRAAALRHPDALRIPHRTFTLEEHERVGDPFLLRLAAIHEAVTDRLRESPPQWFDRSRQWPGIDADVLIPNMPGVLEAFARRNVLVHAAGAVDDGYLKATRSDLPIGTSLDPPASKTIETIDILGALGEAIALAWAPSLDKLCRVDIDGGTDAVYRLVERRRWAEARTLGGQLISRLSDADREGARALQINTWLATREDEGSLESIQEAVQKWEIPAEDPDWQLAVAALLDDVYLTCRLLGRWNDSGKRLTYHRRWPLIQLMSERHNEVRLAVNRSVHPRGRNPRRR